VPTATRLTARPRMMGRQYLIASMMIRAALNRYFASAAVCQA
jgi:hypothetical protein